VAAEARDTDPAIIRKLLEEGHRFTFFRAVQLLQLCHPEAAPVGGPGPARDEVLRLRVELSLTMPRNAVTSIRSIPVADGEGPRYEVTQNLMGLFGSRSPMPEIYTEELLQRALEKDPVRDLLDLFHHRILSLLYRAWARSRPHVGFRADAVDRLTWMVFCIIGLGEDGARQAAFPAPRALLRYAPFLARRSKSAEGLAKMVSDFLGGPRVEVGPYAPRSVAIPSDQRARLGVACCTLGEDFSAGEHIEDLAGKFRLRIGPLDRASYLSLAPGGDGRDLVFALVRLFLLDPLEYDMVLGMLAAERPPFRLANDPEGPRLGIDTWLCAEDPNDAWVFYPGHPAPNVTHPEERAA